MLLSKMKKRRVMLLVAAEPAPILNAAAAAAPLAPVGTKHISKELGISYVFDAELGGFRITEVDPERLLDSALGDGAILEPNDVIIQVGRQPAKPGVDLEILLEQAILTGNRLLIVIDCNDGSTFAHSF